MHANSEVVVWDPLVRVFHWSLVAAFFTSYFTEEELLTPHVWAGYLALGLVLFRVVWGFVGSQHARFADFVYAPPSVLGYLRDLARFRNRRYIGHNPAGGAMILALLVGVVLSSLSGIVIYGADQHAGPLAGLMAGSGEEAEHFWEEVHEVLANVTVAMVVIHVAGVVAESLIHRENLVRAMFTGRKRP